MCTSILSTTREVVICSTIIESPETSETPEIPPDYRAFQDAFSNQAATELPPHQPWDWANDLPPGAMLPKGRVYPLSILEQKAMKVYIEEALKQGFIHPLTSPGGTSFFVGKKDGGLRPCIDYWVLNSQMVKYRYPLPLVPAVLKRLCGAHIFFKLDPCSANNLIRICEDDE